MLEVRLLGAYEVEHDGIVVEIPSRPAKLLLAYLALTAGTPHPRERIAGILWPESDEASARGNLRQALWRLRKAIGGGCLPRDNNMISFETSADCRLDIALLVDPTDVDLVAAVSAYQGELLPGFYEDWVLLERERLRAAFDGKILRLLALLQQEQKWPELLHWAEYWIALGHVPEPAYRSLMIAHAARGDLAAVAHIYDRCVSALELEVGVDPSQETRALYNSLLHGEWPTDPDRVEPELPVTKPVSRDNLPQLSTPFIGREHELEDALQILSTSRLLTIIGPGGMGKTRLALHIAEQMGGQFRNGVHFVSLAPIDSANYLVQTITEAIGFPLSTEELPKSQLLRHLRNRQYLLLLDNFEHLLDGAELVAEILRAAGAVTILTTSRERLNLQEESLLSIEGLAYPGSPTDPQAPESDAVQLFVSSARRLRPGFVLGRKEVEDVTRICQMVQGMPLAILLAAAWVDMLSPGEIAEEMSRGLDFLQTEWSDAPERHRSVRAAIESSWRLLAKPQRELLAKLAMFRGGFTPDAANEIAGASLRGLADLVYKSLIRRNLESGRYVIHELIRQFAWGRLVENHLDREEAAEAHANYFADFMEDRWHHLTDSRQLAALDEIDVDLENIRRAWRYWLNRRNAGRIRQFLDSFWRVYEFRGWFNAGAKLFADAAAALQSQNYEEVGIDEAAYIETVYARALAHQALFRAHLGDVETGQALAEESVAILRLRQRLDEIALPMTTLRWNAYYSGTRVSTAGVSWKSVENARAHSSSWMQAYILCWQGRESSRRQEYETAIRQIDKSYRMFQERGDIISTVWPGMELGIIAISQGAYGDARTHFEVVLRVCEDSNYQWGRAKATRYLGIVLVFTGDFEEAWINLQYCLKLADELGLPRDVINVFYEMAVLDAASGDGEMAVRLLSFIRRHPLGNQTRTISINANSSLVTFQDLAAELLGELKKRLPADIYAAAIKRGRSSTLEEVVIELGPPNRPGRQDFRTLSSLVKRNIDKERNDV